MLLSKSRKFLFIHIQKTAGTSVRHYLQTHISDIEEYKNPHSPVREIDAFCVDYYKACFVRNPYDRLVSWYTMIMDGKKKKNFMQKQVIEKVNTFTDFIMKCEDITNASGWKPFQYNQLDYMVDQNGEVSMDFIGRYENLSNDMVELSKILGLSTDMDFPHVNASKHTYYRDYYTTETKKIIEKRFAKDLSYFNYVF